MHPQFPVVEGHYQMTKAWAVQLPLPFNRRVEDDQLVLWRPGHTIWTSTWGNDENLTPLEQLQWIKDEMSHEAFDVEDEIEGTVARLGYRLTEQSGPSSVHVHYSFTAGPSGYIQMAQYLDDKNDVALAKQIWRNVMLSS